MNVSVFMLLTGIALFSWGSLDRLGATDVKDTALNQPLGGLLLYADTGHDKGKAEKMQDHNEAEEGHRHPQNWLFRLPPGDATEGRQIFVKFECASCHQIKGESFPKPEGPSVGLELSQMGPMHPLEYFTESIIHPNAEISSKRYKGPDGTSKMPSFNEDMTVQELIDISAYLASVRPPGMAKSVTGEGNVIVVIPATEQVVVDHEAIKGFMDAMIMGYKVSPASLLNGLNAGDHIRFTIDTQKKTIVKIEKLKK